MERFYPRVSVDFLKDGLHGKLYALLDGEWPEAYGYDTEGYYSVFVADAT